MRFQWCIVLICLVATVGYSTDPCTVDIQVIDASTEDPVQGVHVFIDQSTIGSYTEGEGQVSLSWPCHLQEPIVLTHLGYVTQYIEQAKTTSRQITVRLQEAELDLSEVVVTAVKERKRKKYLRQFEKVLLGEGPAAVMCEIANPEVVHFKENRKGLQAYANEKIEVNNKALGYQIEFWLDSLVLQQDGSSFYRGNVFFKDTGSQQEYFQARESVFDRSLRHFLQSLVLNTLDAQEYEMGFSVLREGALEPVRPVERKEILTWNEKGHFELRFPEFLEVVDRKTKRAIDQVSAKIRSGRERERFANMSSGPASRIEYATSWLYTTQHAIRLDSQGHVLNPAAMKEYGHWASMRLAHTLPKDYRSAQFSARFTRDSTFDDQNKIDLLLSLILNSDRKRLEDIFKELESKWEVSFYAPLLDIARLASDDWTFQQLVALLQEKSGDATIIDYESGLTWLWQQPAQYGSYYADFKGELYQFLDPKFAAYFKSELPANIRLDEIVWGGVKQDGIPPLRDPKMVPGTEATYLSDDDLVFGVYINGDAKAYPKRILAWHEFFDDIIGGVRIAGVYCTLCGTVIAYDSRDIDLGTSGFLYRSNKLMYDKASQSLWNTIEGRPVVGGQVGKLEPLEVYPVVTSTWSAWKDAHPNTEVLSLQTGHQRDYREGVAYSSYFATDALMFPVPKIDKRLKNKDEVIVIRTPGYQEDPLVIEQKWLAKKGLYVGRIADRPFVIVSDPLGNERAFTIDKVDFKSYRDNVLLDSEGRSWQVTNDFLISPTGDEYDRLPVHRIFWFAWYNAYPETRLVK